MDKQSKKQDKQYQIPMAVTDEVFGMSFKANIDDTRESPSVLFAKLLEEKGYQVIACEPYICLLYTSRCV